MMATYTVQVSSERRNNRRRYHQGYGPKMKKFKSFVKRGYAFGKKHFGPQLVLKEFGRNMLTDILEGCNVKQSLNSIRSDTLEDCKVKQLLKSNGRQAALSSFSGQGKQRRHRY